MLWGPSEGSLIAKSKWYTTLKITPFYVYIGCNSPLRLNIRDRTRRPRRMVPRTRLIQYKHTITKLHQSLPEVGNLFIDGMILSGHVLIIRNKLQYQSRDLLRLMIYRKRYMRIRRINRSIIRRRIKVKSLLGLRRMTGGRHRGKKTPTRNNLFRMKRSKDRPTLMSDQGMMVKGSMDGTKIMEGNVHKDHATGSMVSLLIMKNINWPWRVVIEEVWEWTCMLTFIMSLRVCWGKVDFKETSP